MRDALKQLLAYCPSSFAHLSVNLALVSGNTDDDFLLDPNDGFLDFEGLLVKLYYGGADRVFVFTMEHGLRIIKTPDEPAPQSKKRLEPDSPSADLDLASVIAKTRRAKTQTMGRRAALNATGPYVNGPQQALRDLEAVLRQTRKAFVAFELLPDLDLVGDDGVPLYTFLTRLPTICISGDHLVIFYGSRVNPTLIGLYQHNPVQKLLSLRLAGPSLKEIQAAILEEELCQQRSLLDCSCLEGVGKTLEHMGNQPGYGLKSIVRSVLRYPGCYLDGNWVRQNGVLGLDLAQLDVEEVKRTLQSEILGQDRVKKSLLEHLENLRDYEREKSRPFLRMLFVGPSGVGKTEIAKILCRTIFGSAEPTPKGPMLQVDCMEYQEQHSVAKLLGAPPGYTGHDQPALLEGHCKKFPAGLLLLDDFDKAHPNVHRFFMAILDEGRATSPRSEEGNPIVLDFSDYIVIATTNTGSSLVDGNQRLSLSPQERRRRYEEELKRTYPAELLGRFDPELRLVFDFLSEQTLKEIAKHEAELQLRSLLKLSRDRGLPEPQVFVEEGIYDRFAQTCDPAFGARNLRALVQSTFKRLWREKYIRPNPKPETIEFRNDDFRGEDDGP